MGEERKSWHFYEACAVDSILGVKPTTRPPVVVDTLADDDKEDEETEVEVDGEGPGTRSSSEDSTKEYYEKSVTGQEMEPDTSNVSLVSDEKDKGHIKGHCDRTLHLGPS